MNETELLFTEILKCSRTSLYLNRDTPLENEIASLIATVLKRRVSSEPIQYILGKTEFMGLGFKLTPDVFIPRPETEILVETTLNMVKLLNCQTAKLLDIGTGSGCIAVSLAKSLPNANLTATDISHRAIEVAKENAKLNKVSITFIQSDLFTEDGIRTTDYDMIISNPPYIPSAEIGRLQPELKYEPRIALDGGKDGLEIYRRIINDAPSHLKDGGLLMMEMGFGQKDAIENIFQKSGNFKIIEVVKDYNDIERIIITRRI